MAVMSDKHQDQIRAHSEDIIRIMQPERIIRILYASNVLTADDKGNIEAERTKTKKNDRMLECILDKEDSAYDKFIEALEKSEQHHVAEFLKTSDPPISEPKKVVGASGDPSSERMENNDVDQFDVSDTPIDNLVVTPCTKTFYNQHKNEDCYAISYPRGLALIINVQFKDHRSEREGTDVDRANLKQLWEKLGFKVTVYNDEDGLESWEIMDKVNQFARHPDHKKYSCTVVCILTHGESGCILGTDVDTGGKVDILKLRDLFDNKNCPNLIGKPKLFFIQACRGVKMDDGVEFQDASDDLGKNTGKITKKKPTATDYLMAFPTQHGYRAWRNKKDGSWFIQAVVYIFAKYAATNNLSALLHKVNRIIDSKVSSTYDPTTDQKCEMSECTDGLHKEVYFFPGIKDI